jgi:hypothetical protein
MDAPLASNGNIKTEALPIDLHLEEIQAFPSCIEVIRLFGSVTFGVLSVEKSLEKMSLILLGNSDAEILNLQKNPLGLLF